MNFTSLLFTLFLLNDVNSFYYKNPNILRKKPILKTIEIDNDHPSFIAKTLFNEFKRYGISQSYDDFIQQLKDKQIESVSLVSSNNEINGIISIDNLHKPHEYDMINSHLIQVIPSMTDNIIKQLDSNNIPYDLFIQNVQNNEILSFLATLFQFMLLYTLGGFLVGNLFF